MHDGRSTHQGFAIPGWRVIRSDAGRFWASRETPFPRESEWYAPPFRTVDGDTFEQLRAEVASQEEAARKAEAVAGEATGRATAKETTDPEVTREGSAGEAAP